MHNDKREKMINAWFRMWVMREFPPLETLFSADIIYRECYGPDYKGLNEISLWIRDMLKQQKVLVWDVKHCLHSGNTVVVEWFFKEEQQDKPNWFDGVSIIEFTDDNKILSIKEFESKTDRTRPYLSA